MPLVLLALAIFVLPGAAERLGWVPDDEGLRIPLVFVALALGLGMPARSPSRSTVALAILAIVPGVLALAGAAGRTPAETPLSLVGAPYLPFALAAAVLVGSRWRVQFHHAEGDHKGRPYGHSSAALVAATVAGVVAALWATVERILGLPAVGPFGRAGVAGPTLAALALVAAPPILRLRGDEHASVVAVRSLAPVTIVVGVLATGSRAGMLALLGGAVTMAFALRQRIVVGVLAIVLLAAVGYASIVGVETVRVRVGVATAAVALTNEKPVVGQGAYGFSREALRVRDLEEARISSGARPLAAHNDVLHAAAEGGFAAGLAVAAFLVLACARSIRRARRGDVESAGESRETTGLACLAGTIACLVVASLAEDPLLSSSTVLTLGIAAGWVVAVRPSADAAGPPGGRPQGSPLRRSPLMLAAAGLCAAAAVAHVVVLAQTAETRLSNGSFRASEPMRANVYEFAVAAAREERFDEARRRYATLLAWDPGATEARLDIAETLHRERRVDDAIAALEAARPFDPTRFDVPHRIGHLRFGDEPLPLPEPSPSKPLARPRLPESEAALDVIDRGRDVTGALRAYNEAAALASDRFETAVAMARIHRWNHALSKAGEELRRATAIAARRGQGLPAEILLESFRLAEAQRASTIERTTILQLALVAGPAAAGTFRREANVLLEFALLASDSALVYRDAATKALRDEAVVRLAALVRARLADVASLRAQARELAGSSWLEEQKNALALYRALLSDPFAALDTDLVLEARAVAAPIDRDLADQFGARARTLLGYEQLAKGDAAKAEFEFNAAVKRDFASVSAHVGHARAVLRQGRADDAVHDLEVAVKLDPSAYDEIAKIDELRDVLAKVARPAPASDH